jgi:hypothetical protein
LFFLVVLLRDRFEDKFLRGHGGIFVQEFGSPQLLGAYFYDVLKVVKMFELNCISVLNLALSLILSVLKIQIILSKVVANLSRGRTEILSHIGN